jgi:hypothetical protein
MILFQSTPEGDSDDYRGRGGDVKRKEEIEMKIWVTTQESRRANLTYLGDVAEGGEVTGPYLLRVRVKNGKATMRGGGMGSCWCGDWEIVTPEERDALVEGITLKPGDWDRAGIAAAKAEAAV